MPGLRDDDMKVMAKVVIHGLPGMSREEIKALAQWITDKATEIEFLGGSDYEETYTCTYMAGRIRSKAGRSGASTST